MKFIIGRERVRGWTYNYTDNWFRKTGMWLSSLPMKDVKNSSQGRFKKIFFLNWLTQMCYGMVTGGLGLVCLSEMAGIGNWREGTCGRFCESGGSACTFAQWSNRMRLLVGEQGGMPVMTCPEHLDPKSNGKNPWWQTCEQKTTFAGAYLQPARVVETNRCSRAGQQWVTVAKRPKSRHCPFSWLRVNPKVQDDLFWGWGSNCSFLHIRLWSVNFMSWAWFHEPFLEGQRGWIVSILFFF